MPRFRVQQDREEIQVALEYVKTSMLEIWWKITPQIEQELAAKFGPPTAPQVGGRIWDGWPRVTKAGVSIQLWPAASCSAWSQRKLQYMLARQIVDCRLQLENSDCHMYV